MEGALTTNEGASAIEALLSGDPQESVEPEEEISEEAPVAESDAEPEESGPEPAEEGESEPQETVELETLDDIARALGVSETDLLATLKMRAKVNGKDELISLADVQRGYQLESNLRQKTAELAEQRKAHEQEMAQRRQYLDVQAAQTAHVLNLAEQTLVSEMSAPEMAALKAQDPVKWLTVQMDAREKLAAIQQAKQKAAEQWQEHHRGMQQEQQQHLQQVLTQEREALSTKLGSEWTGDTQAKLGQYLLEQGFAPDQVANIYDHKIVLMALKAMKWEAAERAAKQTKQKLVTAPPIIQKPGKSKSGIAVQQSKVAELRKRASRSGRVGDAASLIANLM